MVVQKNSVVRIHYVLKDADGTLLDSTEETEPVEYIQGNGFLLPKLEESLEGKSMGDRLTVSVEPKDGYGEWDASLVMEVPRSNFATDAQIEEGMQFHAGARIVTVKKVEDDLVTVDANHQLAGKNLVFEIEVVSVREATEEELSFAQSGGCGGCGGDCSSGCGGGCGCTSCSDGGCSGCN